MKRTLLFLACVLTSITMLAQEYFPEGTKWTEIRLDTLKYDSWYSKVGDEWVPNFETIEYYVKGEYTTKYGEKYKCIYTNGPEWTDSLTFGIQEGELIQYNEDDDVIVTVFAPDDYGSYSPLGWAETYQFDWDKGKGIFYKDLFMSTTTYAVQYQHYYGIIDEIKEGYFGGVRPLKYVDLDGKAPECGKYDNPQKINTQGGRIIQGIGITEWNDGECLFGPPNPYGALDGEYHGRHYRSMLVHFERNGEVLYNVWPEKETTDDSDYLPFVELDKQWHVVSSPTNPYVPCHLEKYWMAEEVEHDGKQYIQTYLIDDEQGTYKKEGLYREENRRVYKYDEIVGREIMMYDFSLKEGDRFVYELNRNYSANCKVLKQGWLEDGPDIVSSCTSNPDGTLDIKYRKLRTWTIAFDDDDGDYVVATWVECVGTLDNMFDYTRMLGTMSCLAYIERKDYETDNEYLPFSLYQMYGPVYGCNLPTGKAELSEDGHHQLTYELEGDRLHIYGKVLTHGGPNNYAYFFEETTDDNSVRKLHFNIKEIEPLPDPKPGSDGMLLHATDFYVPGFNPNRNYYVIDNRGVEHPVINKAPLNVYHPFIEDDKVWAVRLADEEQTEEYFEYYYFDGDTIINGQTAKRMLYDRIGSNWDTIGEYIGAWYEQDKKVYYAGKGKQQFELLYDFTLSTGDIIQSEDLVLQVTKMSGSIPGFKGTYLDLQYINTAPIVERWLEGVGSQYYPWLNLCARWAGVGVGLLFCKAGDEIIYYNSEEEDPFSMGAKKHRFDFTHTIKTKPKAPSKREKSDARINSSEREVARPKVKARTREDDAEPLYGEYSDQQLGINLDPLDEAYLVRITNESDKVVYEKTINAGSIVGLNIDISAFAKGRYTVTMENSSESFTGEFETITTGIQELINEEETKNFNSSTLQFFNSIYNLQGQRLNRLQKGLNIVNGRKVFVK